MASSDQTKSPFELMNPLEPICLPSSGNRRSYLWCSSHATVAIAATQSSSLGRPRKHKHAINRQQPHINNLPGRMSIIIY
eukprot:scaffold1556_cov28-Prasinocladus_malaysianus.AAC.1